MRRFTPELIDAARPCRHAVGGRWFVDETYVPGIKTDRSAQIVIRGHAFMQNLRRGDYELGTHGRTHLGVAAAFDELTGAV